MVVVPLSMLSAVIIGHVGGSIIVPGEVYTIKMYVANVVSDFQQPHWVSLETSVSSTNKIERKYIT